MDAILATIGELATPAPIAAALQSANRNGRLLLVDFYAEWCGWSSTRSGSIRPRILDNVRRVGAEGHACTDEQYEVLRDAGALNQDIVRGAQEVIIVGRIREMLLD